MKQHRTDLVALLFGLAFTIVGSLVMVSQVTGVDVDPHWAAATGLIVLGAVALVATVARARRDAIDYRGGYRGDYRASGPAPSPEEPTG